MIGVLKKIWDFAGEEQDNIRKSMILGFFYAVFHMFQIAAIYVVVLALVGGSTDSAPAWQALGLLLASILGRAVLNRFSQLQQTHAGYFMVANKRISIGDKLKGSPWAISTTRAWENSPASPPPFWTRWRVPAPWCWSVSWAA